MYTIHPLLLASSTLICFTATIAGNFAYYDQSFSLLICCSFLAGFTKRFHSTFPNNLEFKLEGLTMLCILALVFQRFATAELFSAAFFVISISAGSEKIKSPSWKPNGLALISFLTAPWQLRSALRRYICTHISKFYSTNQPFRIFITSLQIITPWAQVISGTVVLISLFRVELLTALPIVIILQVVFAITLLLVADLNWIPHFQAWLTINFYHCFEIKKTLSLENNPIDGWTSIGAIYLLAYIFFTMFSESMNTQRILPIFAKKILSTIAIPLQPFSMFTENENKPLITHSVKTTENKFTKNFFALKQITRHSRNLVYQLYETNEFAILHHKYIIPQTQGKTSLFKRQLYSVTNYLGAGEILLYVQIWDNEKHAFESTFKSKLTVEKLDFGIQKISLNAH